MYKWLPEFLCTTCVQCSWQPAGGTEFPGTGTTDSCKLPCGCWDLNVDPVEEQWSLTTKGAGLSLCFLQPPLGETVELPALLDLPQGFAKFIVLQALQHGLDGCLSGGEGWL